MKKSIGISIFLIVSLSLTLVGAFQAWRGARPAKGGQPVGGEACPAEALLILQAETTAEAQQTLGALEAQGGCALHSFLPAALIGRLPAQGADELPGVAAVYTAPVAAASLAEASPLAQVAGGVWNALLQPEASPVSSGRPLVGDQRVQTISPAAPAQPTGLNAPNADQMGEYMWGRVAVGIILPESNGASDPSTENWDASRMTSVTNEIIAALNWWAALEGRANLSFFYDIHLQTATSYEPINRPSTDDPLWIYETLGNLGISGGSAIIRSINYLNAIRTANNTDWAMQIFVVDSQNNLPGTFTDGYFGYTQFYNYGAPPNYPYTIVMTYDNDGWGISSMNDVLAHEAAHWFGADDEYCQPGYACSWGNSINGYLGIGNPNCEGKCDQYGPTGYPPPNGICDGNDHTPGSNCQACTVCPSVTCLMRQGG
jgi:hypothetical protein